MCLKWKEKVILHADYQVEALLFETSLLCKKKKAYQVSILFLTNFASRLQANTA